jgi:general secretion pathway protein A
MIEDPFSLSPNPATLFITPGLKSALHKIRYTIHRRQGLTCILGDVGMGKSSVVRLLYGDFLAREDCRTAFIPNPSFKSDFAFLQGLCGELDVSLRKSYFKQENELKEYLAEQYSNKVNVVIFVDEAQKLDQKMLESIRSMLNFETNTAKLIQFVLAGQLELRDRLKEEKNKAIDSRVFAYSLLDPLSFGEMKRMIAHRCEQAEMPVPFPEEVMEAVYEMTKGIPRDILKLCAQAYETSTNLMGEKSVTMEAFEIVREDIVRV